MSEAEQRVYAKLKEYRSKTDITIRPTPLLRQVFTDYSGTKRDLKLRYYQVQMILHLLAMRRFVVGDDTGTGKTLMVIAACCYVWEKEPNVKVLVLTKKSAVTQWRDEILRFTQGVQVFVVKGSKSERQQVYADYQAATGPTVLIAGYRSIAQDFTSVQSWKWDTVAFDECFQYNTPVMLADGTTELIGKIVTQQMNVEVLSFNPSTGVVEPKRVTQWHRNTRRARSLLALSFRFGGNVRVTRTHHFIRKDNSKVEAQALRLGHEVAHLCKNVPSEDQMQLILGGLLGDASISHPNRPAWGIAFIHGANQRAYLEFKRKFLAPLGVSEITPTRGGYSNTDLFRFRLNANEAVTGTLVKARVRRQNKKHVTFEWLDKVGPLGLAIWYADDGAINTHVCADGQARHTIILHTQGFTRDEVEFLSGWLAWRWGVRSEVKTTKARTDRVTGDAESYPYLYLSPDESQKFLALLPCGFPGVEYKFPNKPIRSSADFDTVPTTGMVSDWVTSKSVWVPPEKEHFVYDLEVEDNHNYFANGTLVSNCTVFKTPKTYVHQVCRHISNEAQRVWGLTATLIKNNLVEGYGIYKVILPDLFKHTPATFVTDYCDVEMINIGKNRKVPRIVGYKTVDILRFRDKISPFYLGRPKHEVASELPPLTTIVRKVALEPFQALKYQEALAGLLTVRKDGEFAEKEVSKLVAVTYCQEITNHPGLIGFPEEESDKLNELLDMLTEGDLAGEKVIIFTRFAKMVDIGVQALASAKIKSVRITGAEGEDARKAAQDTFQSTNSGTNVVWITTAGSDAINLQAAKAIIFYDTPFSAGDYLQVLGRMIRIGSIHDRVFAYHLVARDTVDERVMAIIESKMELIERVLGKRIKGEDDDEMDLLKVGVGDISALFEMLKTDAAKGYIRVA